MKEMITILCLWLEQYWTPFLLWPSIGF